MSLQPERIAQLCEILKLPAIHAEWPACAQRAAHHDIEVEQRRAVQPRGTGRIARKGDRTIYLQSTYMLVYEQAVRREYASLESIQDNYAKLVVSLDDFCLPSHEGIRHVRAWELHGLL